MPLFTTNNSENSMTGLSSGGFSGGGSAKVFGLAAEAAGALAPLTIPVGANPAGIAFAPGRKVLVANENGASVSVVDIDKRSVVDVIPLPSDFYPHGIAVTPDGTQAWVTSSSSRNATVVVVDLATKKTSSTPLVGNSFIKVKITPDGSQAWVVSDFDGSVTVIDTLTRTIVTVIRNIPNAWDLTFNRTATRAYLVSSTPLDGSVKVIDTAAYSVINSIATTGKRPRDIRITKDGRWLFVTHHDSNFIAQIDVLKGTVARTIDVGGRSSGLALIRASKAK